MVTVSVAKRKENAMFENIICKKKCEDSGNLTKKHYFDAGLDVKSNENCTINAGDSKVILTGLYLQIPEGFVGLIWSRSGISVNNKIEVGAGCIDSGYRGEVKVHLYNFGDKDFIICRGDRIAQLLTIPVCLNEYVVVDKLDDTERGDKGIGSSGV